MTDLPPSSPDGGAADDAEKSGGEKLMDWVRGLLPAARESTANDDDLREAIEELIEEKEAAPSSVASHERMLISNILQLRDLPVSDVMVPRADIVAIDIQTPREGLLSLMVEKPHSRLPVYKDDLDNIVGVIHMKDLIARVMSGETFDIKDVLREALVVSPSMRVMDLLLQMRQSKVHIAFVVDEYGGIDGLITINDLIEAIVGKIDDEFDFDIAPQFIERADGTVTADARYPLPDFERIYGNVFSEDEENQDVDTLGGLTVHIAGHVPARGEIVTHEESGIEFEVLDADPRRVTRLRLRNLPPKVSPGASE